jgi:hypothetical protein
MGMPSLREAVDFVRNPDFFGGKLQIGPSKTLFFTPTDPSVGLSGKMASALYYWSGLNIAFQYVVNVGNTTSVYPFGTTHFVDPSGLKGTRTQDAYFRWLNQNHPGRISRQVYDKPGKGIPDMITSENSPNSFIYYEIKPDNPQGLSDGREKLTRIRDTLNRFTLPPYRPGPAIHIRPLNIVVMNNNVGAGVMKVSLDLRVPDPGLIVYKFRVDFSIDPGQFITKAVIALAIVAILEGGAAALGSASSAAGGTAGVVEEVGFQKVRVALMEEVVRVVAEDGPQIEEWLVEQATRDEPLKKLFGR